MRGGNSRQSKFAGILVFLGLLLAIAWIAHSPPESPIVSPTPSGATLNTPRKAAEHSRPDSTPLTQPERAAVAPSVPQAASSAAQPRSPLADTLNTPEKTGGEDAETVYSLLKYYRQAFGSFPTGEDNRQMIRALTGSNPKHLAILPTDHPAINSRGELVDRWQTPYFFHLLSRELVEVRSAGPDREMFTGDDLVRGSPELQQKKR